MNGRHRRAWESRASPIAAGTGPVPAALLRVAVAGLTACERFLKEHLTRVSGVASFESSLALNPVKYSTALPLGV